MTVHRLSVPYDRVPHGAVNAYLVDADDSTVLVDPPVEHADVDALLDARLGERTLDAVVVTHHHPDHAGGIAAYARDHGATVWCRVGRESAFAAAAGITPDRTFSEGTRIADAVTVLDTPGHAPEHVAFTAPDGLICGDLAVDAGSVAVAAPEGDLRAYLTSLRRVRALAPSRLYPGHGPIVDAPVEICDRLLRHRLDREARVLAAVRGGARRLDAVTDAAYEKDVSTVRTLAVATVKAHVEKLATERRVLWDGTHVRPVDTT